MPLFSIVIPVYNRYEQVKRAIESVLSQNRGDYEIIVVDDGSTDETGHISEEYDRKIKYVRQENRGVSSARNHGIRLSRAPYIALLDSDDCWQPSKLNSHINFIRNNPGIKIHQCEDIWVRNSRRVNPAIKHLKAEGDIFTRSLEMCLISPSSVVISREIFDIYGLFDEEMPVCEDYDLWLRITPFEKTGLIKEKLITRYSGHPDQLSSLYWGMDRFRVYSILKLLEESGERLPNTCRDEAIKCAERKLLILKNGAERRGNIRLSEATGRLLTGLRDGYCMRKDYQTLLKI